MDGVNRKAEVSQVEYVERFNIEFAKPVSTTWESHLRRSKEQAAVTAEGR